VRLRRFDRSDVQYLMASCGDGPTVAAPLRGSVAHYEWLVAQGVPSAGLLLRLQRRAAHRRRTVWSAPSAHPFCGSRRPRRSVTCRKWSRQDRS
jgi:hypothetical protein